MVTVEVSVSIAAVFISIVVTILVAGIANTICISIGATAVLCNSYFILNHASLYKRANHEHICVSILTIAIQVAIVISHIANTIYVSVVVTFNVRKSYKNLIEMLRHEFTAQRFYLQIHHKLI